VSWGLIFRIRQALKGSLWVTPLVGGLVGMAISYSSVWVDRWAGVPTGWTYTPSTALTVLTTVVASSVSLTGFVVTVSVLVVQMSTGSFSARYMRLFYRDRVLKGVLAVLAMTFALSFSLLRHVDDSVPELGVTLSGFFLGFALFLFLVFLDRFVHRLRAVKVASLVAAAGRTALLGDARALVPGSDERASAEIDALLASAPTLVVRASGSGTIQAIDGRGLVRLASRCAGVIVLRHAVGDFVSAGEPIAELRGASGTLPGGDVERRVRGLFALGVERTIEQDPAFALRILVDIAVRALSPAVNDPTTAVQVIDYLEDLLTSIGTTPGLDSRLALRDGTGRLRIVLPSRRWEDFLSVGVTEIRTYGGGSVQVSRRVRAMLMALLAAVLPPYRAAVASELARLDETVAAAHPDESDRQLARVADRQGIGGPPPFATGVEEA
jgi:uncharacterized membrane protein